MCRELVQHCGKIYEVEKIIGVRCLVRLSRAEGRNCMKQGKKDTHRDVGIRETQRGSWIK